MESWLRYADDLGLSPFFRDRAIVAAVAVATIDVPSGAVISEPMPKPKQTSSSDSARGLSSASAASVAPKAIVPPAKAPFVPAGATLFPIAAAGPSLFEAAERIENDSMERIRGDIGDCTRCKLHEQRHHIVFADGDPKAELVFIGEGPGHDEDMQGVPFVGRAGKLLTQMIEAMGLKRGDVYICNVVKCRPPENRTPEKEEVATCSPFLMRQLDVVRPKVIVALGSCAAQTLLQTTQGISRFRGEWLEFRGTKLMATYHPAYLLRNPAAKSEVWKDLQKVMAVLGLPPRKSAPPA